MQTEDPDRSLSEYRIQARRLLKQLRSEHDEDAIAAATRFRRLRSFANKAPAQIASGCDRVQLKHALTVIALEGGYSSWRTLKATLQAPSETIPRDPGREMYEPALGVFLNRWFARYEDARESREQLGGYLLPFDRQYFVCEEEGIRVLGLDPHDPCWERIGWDWVKPADPEAMSQLRAKRADALRQEAPPSHSV